MHHCSRVNVHARRRKSIQSEDVLLELAIRTILDCSARVSYRRGLLSLSKQQRLFWQD